MYQFLMGLDDGTFGRVRSNTLDIDPLPNINKAYNMIFREERYQNMVRGQWERDEADALASEKSLNLCSICHKIGHISQNCFQSK